FPPNPYFLLIPDRDPFPGPSTVRRLQDRCGVEVLERHETPTGRSKTRSSSPFTQRKLYFRTLQPILPMGASVRGAQNNRRELLIWVSAAPADHPFVHFVGEIYVDEQIDVRDGQCRPSWSAGWLRARHV